MSNSRTLWSLMILTCFILLGMSQVPEEQAQIEDEEMDVVEPIGPRVRYEIWVELDAAEKELSGREHLAWTNHTQEPVSEMLLHLYWNAFKNEASTFFKEIKEESLFPRGSLPEDGEWGWIDITDIRLEDGTELTSTMAYVTPDSPGQPGDQTVMKVSFPEAVPPGEEVRLRLEFQAKIPRTVARSGYYKNSFFIAQWYPKPGVYEEGRGWNAHAYHQNSEFFADFADFTVHITVPEDFTVGASGVQTSVRTDEAEKESTYTFTQTMIHDFAWMADPRYLKVERDFIADQEISPQEYEETAALLGLPLDEVKLPNTKMILLIAPEHKKQTDRHFRALRAALKSYGLWYGPYPYETITMVDPPYRTGSGGMEYPTFFTAGTAVIAHEDVHSPEGVIVHEFGHGYWYGLVANNEFEEAWLDEGINTYSTGRVMARAYGPGVLPLSFKGFPLAALLKMPKYLDYELDRALAINVVPYDPIVTDSWRFFNTGSYAGNVYMRASTCLNTLERLLGEQTMARIMRTFHTRFRYKHPKTQDFIDVANEISGQDLAWFFENLFYSTLNFDYGISSLKSVEKPRYLLGIFDVAGEKEEMTRKTVRDFEALDKKESGGEKKEYRTTVTLRRFGEARLGGEARVKLKVVFADGSEEIRFWDGQGRWTKMVFTKPVKAEYAQIDPEGIWIIDSNFANNSRTRRPIQRNLLDIAGKTFHSFQNFLLFLSSFS